MLIADASIFTKLFSNNINPSVLSGFETRKLTFSADFSPSLNLCLSLYLFTLIKDVSEPDKKADNRSKINNIINKFSILISVI